MPFCASFAVTPVTLASVVRTSTSPAPASMNGASRKGLSRSAVSGRVGERSGVVRLPDSSVPRTSVSRAPLQPETDAVAADRPAQDGDTVHVLAGDADPGEARRHRVTALQHHAGEVDAGAGRRRDDHAALGRVGDPVAAGAHSHLALHLGAGARRSEARRDAVEWSEPASTVRASERVSIMAAPGSRAPGGTREPRGARSRGSERWSRRARRAPRPRAPPPGARACLRRPRR